MLGGTCQLKNIEGVILDIQHCDVWLEDGYTNINWDCPTPRCCESLQITEDPVLGSVQACEDVFDHIVVSPGVPALIK